MYGKLAVLKSYGEKPTFAILGKNGQIEEVIPNVEEWLLKRIGKTISFTLSDIYWQVCDIAESNKA